MPSNLREIQRPFKGQYRKDPTSAQITLRASSAQASGSALACSIDLGRALYKAQAHAGVGGSGAGACSADLLLGALAACAQITCQMVAEGLQIPVRSVRVPVEGDLDLRGILGPADQAPVGFSAIRMRFDIDAPDASSQQIESLREKSERYCVVYQTLVSPPVISTSWTQP